MDLVCTVSDSETHFEIAQRVLRPRRNDFGQRVTACRDALSHLLI